jgi:cytoskeletal protein CcmA (bactofilin family)
MRWKKVLIGLFLALALLAGVGGTAAREIRQGDQCLINANETIDGNLFVLCRSLIINGTVNGNVIGAATSTEINGEVTENVYLTSGQLDMSGTLGDDLHFAGAVLRIHPTAQFDSPRNDVWSLSLSTSILPDATIPGSVISRSYQMVIDGEVDGEVTFWGSALTIDGRVVGDIDATVGDPAAGDASQLQTLLIPFRLDVNLEKPGLRISEDAAVDGQLRYTSTVEGDIQGDMASDPIYTPVTITPDFTPLPIGEEENPARNLSAYFTQVLREFVTLGLLGLISLLIAPRSLQAPMRQLQLRPLTSLGVGVLTFILSFPIALIALILTLLIIFILSLLQINSLVIAVGFLMGIIDIGGASIFYFTAIFITRVVIGLALGRFIIRAIAGDDGSQRVLFISLFAGVGALSILVSLPVIGVVINGIAAVAGLGAILNILQVQLRNMREVAPSISRAPLTPSAQLPRRPYEARQFPPPIIDDSKRPRGTDNLPDGFRWWDED